MRVELARATCDWLQHPAITGTEHLSFTVLPAEVEQYAPRSSADQSEGPHLRARLSTGPSATLRNELTPVFADVIGKTDIRA